MPARGCGRAGADDYFARLCQAHAPRCEHGRGALRADGERHVCGRDARARRHRVAELRSQPRHDGRRRGDRVVRVAEDREQRVGQPALDPRRGLAQLVARDRERALGDDVDLARDAEVDEDRARRDGLLARLRERDVLAQDRLLELLEPSTRLDPEVLAQQAAAVAVRLERLRLAARAVQSEHQLGPERLAERVGRDERLELAGDLRSRAAREVCVDPALDRGQAQLLEPGGLEREVDVGERLAAPEVERLAQERGRARGLGACRLGRQPLEPAQVELVRFAAEDVARRARLDRTVAERLAQLRDVDLERRRRRRRRRVGPELVDQPLDRDDPAGLEREDGQERPLLATTDRDRPAVAPHLEWTEHGVLHGTVLAPV